MGVPGRSYLDGGAFAELLAEEQSFVAPEEPEAGIQTSASAVAAVASRERRHKASRAAGAETLRGAEATSGIEKLA